MISIIIQFSILLIISMYSTVTFKGIAVWIFSLEKYREEWKIVSQFYTLVSIFIIFIIWLY